MCKHFLSANDLDKVITSTLSNSVKTKLSLLQCLDRFKSNDPSQNKQKAYQQGPKKRLVHADTMFHEIKKCSTKNFLMPIVT